MYLGPISLTSSIRLPMALTEEQKHSRTRNDIYLQDQVPSIITSWWVHHSMLTVSISRCMLFQYHLPKLITTIERCFFICGVKWWRKRHWDPARIRAWVLWILVRCSYSTYRVAAAITQFTGGSTKYFSTHHAEVPKPERDPAWELNCIYG